MKFCSLFWVQIRYDHTIYEVAWFKIWSTCITISLLQVCTIMILVTYSKVLWFNFWYAFFAKYRLGCLGVELNPCYFCYSLWYIDHSLCKDVCGSRASQGKKLNQCFIKKLKMVSFTSQGYFLSVKLQIYRNCYNVFGT